MNDTIFGENCHEISLVRPVDNVEEVPGLMFEDIVQCPILNDISYISYVANLLYDNFLVGDLLEINNLEELYKKLNFGKWEEFISKRQISFPKKFFGSILIKKDIYFIRKQIYPYSALSRGKDVLGKGFSTWEKSIVFREFGNKLARTDAGNTYVENMPRITLTILSKGNKEKIHLRFSSKIIRLDTKTFMPLRLSPY